MLLFFVGVTLPAAAQYAFNGAQLERLRTEYRAGEPKAVTAVGQVAEAAKELLAMEPLRVTAKKQVPPSGDKRDYMSLSPYWWADPSKADGLPYIRHDGERNPEVYDYPERENGDKLGEAARTLSVLYYVTGEERYAEKCAELLRVWFLDPEQGMNPNMTYAQLIPGRTSIRGTGIIDSRRMCFAINASQLIESSPAWTSGDRAELGKWAGAYLYWLEHSVNGLKELHAQNNHGLWYDAIRIMTARAAGDREHMLHIARESAGPRFAVQVAPDGSLPKELERTLSLHYSTFVLEALSVARNVSLDAGYDLWTLPEAQRALEYLIPYYLEPAKWPHKQIKPFDQRRAAALLFEAGEALGRLEWVELAHKIGYKGGSPDYERMLNFELR